MVDQQADIQSFYTFLPDSIVVDLEELITFQATLESVRHQQKQMNLSPEEQQLILEQQK